MIDLSYLVENDSFIACPLLPTDNFIQYCKERGLEVSQENLEDLERMGILFPVARIRRPTLTVKIKYSEDRNSYTDLGLLEDGEQWAGDTKEEYAGFSFEKDYANGWLNQGLLWQPSSRPFTPWNTRRDSDGREETISYYSIFQCYPLHEILKQARANIDFGRVVLPDTKQLSYWQKFLRFLTRRKWKKLSAFAKRQLSASLLQIEWYVDFFTASLDSLKKYRSKDESHTFLYQVLANRYFPYTQSDRRTISVPGRGTHIPIGWDWHDYRRTWNARQVLSEVGLTPEDCKKLYERLLFRAEWIDPLESWYELVEFVSYERKKKLKGEALLAQSFYAMSQMLRLFYRDITGERLPKPNEGGGFNLSNFYGFNVIDDELRHLEYLTNRYHLNPRPRLILVVEGKGEEEQIPRLARELLGHPLPLVGVQVYNLSGVGNFTGRKRQDRYGALEKFIDYHHSRETIVFVLLDNEGRVPHVRDNLLKAPSLSYPDRKITKAKYIHVWEKNIEFDNFGHDEIARAMTKLDQERHIFTEAEIACCEQEKSADPLATLFNGKAGWGLSKPMLLKILVDGILSRPEEEFEADGKPKRPLTKIIRQVLELAFQNYQPVTSEIGEHNQRSGHFGDIIER